MQEVSGLDVAHREDQAYGKPGERGEHVGGGRESPDCPFSDRKRERRAAQEGRRCGNKLFFECAVE